MKKNIHPAYYPNAVFTCACGATYKIGSTKENINVEICSNCHPFFTGRQQLIDTAGRVEKFEKRKAKASAPKPQKVRIKKTPTKKNRKQNKPNS